MQLAWLVTLLAVITSAAQIPISVDVPNVKLRADAGDVDAQVQLAKSYLGSFYWAEAEKWFRKAADKGSTNAQYELGMLLLHGKLAFPQRSPKVSADPAQAARWLKKAAINGHAEAQHAFGRCNENGTGVRKDLVEAFKWYTLASRQGSIMGKTHRDQLALKLDAAAIRDGERRVGAFVVGVQPSVWDSIVLQGISQTARGWLAIVNGETVAAGEHFRIVVDGAKVNARCETITDTKAIIVIGDEAKVLTLAQ